MFGAVTGQEPGNKGRRFPPEPLTPDEVAAIIGECSARSRTGIRNRALLVALYRSGCFSRGAKRTCASFSCFGCSVAW
jgi:site-specific recombinase XerD